ncbi:MAG: hypothetical protein O2930_01335 [Acidobacteria bacterium]|nr:hypothetical protein [Acidobacteriota bacterium]
MNDTHHEMTVSEGTHHGRSRAWRWVRRLAVGLVASSLLLAFGSWLRGQAQWGPFSGQLVDEETGAPIAGAHVMVSWDRRLPTLTGDGGRSFLYATESVTDDDGRFELTGRPPYWELFATPPELGFFAPAYVARGRDVTPPGGVRFVDPTVVNMQPLTTRDERCIPQNRAGVPLHGEAPRFRDAIYAYDRELRCFESQGTTR